MQRRDRVHSFELVPCGDHIVALLTVALHLDPLVVMPVLNDNNQAGPSFGQVVGSHPLPTFVALAALHR